LERKGHSVKYNNPLEYILKKIEYRNNMICKNEKEKYVQERNTYNPPSGPLA
tara:strand:+ start:495 stop:650 length:156 start_codon:yes stop_codon:yes gene_type:complete